MLTFMQTCNPDRLILPIGPIGQLQNTVWLYTESLKGWHFIHQYIYVLNKVVKMEKIIKSIYLKKFPCRDLKIQT